MAVIRGRLPCGTLLSSLGRFSVCARVSRRSEPALVGWHTSCGVIRMAFGLQSRNQRRSCRVDALLRVKGELVPLRHPIRIFNLNRTGLAVLSEARFRSGERWEFRLTGIGGPSVHVTAAAVHTQSVPDSPGLYLTGFEYQPERPGGAVPEAAIRQLVAAIAPAGFHV